MYRNHLSPPVFPQAWVSDWGEDRYGLWIAFTLHGVRQMFRWCEPGSFWMGSPDDEPDQESAGKETFHKVTFSNGFWLADTTVTQALWQVVMEGNPSEFRVKERPVEKVSWYEIQQFIKRINTLVSDLNVHLPTEAQWEYGCRAGTTTLYSFGEAIASNQVNYGAILLFDGGSESEVPGQTVDVKSLPCNDWGLFEMHGNVWEWCQDWYQVDLGREPVVNPSGAGTGINRVLRGGFWMDRSSSIRSAYRFAHDPGSRYDSFGFRLSLGHGLR